MIVSPERASGFASLASLLRSAPATPPAVTASPLLLPVLDPDLHVDIPQAPETAAEATDAIDLDDAPEEIAPEATESLLADVRCFRARLAEALSAATVRLAAGIAADVLGRELLTAPADVERIARRLVDEYWSESPLQVRVSPHDRVRLEGVAVATDPTLRSGDCAIDFADGTYESTLGIRLSSLLEDACRV